MGDPVLRQRVLGRQVDSIKPVLCRLTGLPVDECEDCGAHCARCGCSDFAACPGGCEWVPTDEPVDVCSNCVELS